MQRGKFISIEGGEGAGKSTNMAFVGELLSEAGLRVVMTREPGGTPLAEEIRTLLLARRDEPMSDITELLLIFAARAQHRAQLIEPALVRGDWVLSDRFTDATLAYQGAGRGIDMRFILALKSMLLKDFGPDLTLLLDVPVSRGMQRVGARGARDRFEIEDEAFFRRVRDGYLSLAHAEPARFRVIDADQPIANVQSSIREAILGIVGAAAGQIHDCT